MSRTKNHGKMSQENVTGNKRKKDNVNAVSVLFNRLLFLYKTLALVSPALTSITQVSLTLIPNPSISNHNPIISSPNL